MLRPQTPFERYIRHPLEAFVALFFWGIFRALPIDAASGLGGWLGRTIGPKLSASNRARNNIRRAMPTTGDQGVETIVRDMWDNLARTVAEFPHVSNLPLDGSDPRIQIYGLEHLQGPLDADSAVLFFSAHLGNWELAPLSAVANGYPMTFVYREANNRLVEKLFRIGRKNLGDDLIKKGGEGAKGILSALKQKKFVAMLVDQKMNDGIAVPFFGIDAMTAPALGLMAVRHNCPVVPARVIRLAGARFRVEVMPAMYPETDNLSRDEAVLAFMTRVNAVIEDWIKEHPGQWLWLHNRWPGS